MGTGRSWRRGVGRGWKTSLGASRRSIMDVGQLLAEAGDGFPARYPWLVRSMFVPCTRLLWWRSWEAADLPHLSNLAAQLELELLGFRWARATFGCPLTTSAKPT